MQRYAAWKAADIRKALRQGRQPTPGNGNAAPEDLLPGVPPQQVCCNHRWAALQAPKLSHVADWLACTCDARCLRMEPHGEL